MSDRDDIYMKRCFDLASLGGKEVRPNPLVGAVLVYNDKIIGEGYHKKFGAPHAEVEAISSIPLGKRHLIKDSTFYVSLEPCNYYGKTPACSELILQNEIKKLVVSTEDPNPKISGSSLKYLEAKGVSVKRHVLKEQGEDLIKVFSKNIKTSKPYVVLKFAESSDHFIGKTGERIQLSNELSNIFVHKLRTDIDGILVGTNTVLTDNPALTTRHVNGNNPVKIALDRNLTIPVSYDMYKENAQVIIINEVKDLNSGLITFKKMDFYSSLFLDELLQYLWSQGIYHLLVEGGAKLLNSFIDGEHWDEAIIISTPKILNKGIKTPNLSGNFLKKIRLRDDVVSFVSKNV